MKIKKGFVLRDVAGRSVVVATGAAITQRILMVRQSMHLTGMKGWERVRTKLLVVCGIRVIQILVAEE